MKKENMNVKNESLRERKLKNYKWINFLIFIMEI